MDERVLADAFLPFGEIADVTIPKPELPSSKEPHRGFGYIEFEHPEDAKEAIENMDQSELFGRVLKVAAAKPQKENNEGLGSKTAVWEQVCLQSKDDFDCYDLIKLHFRRVGLQNTLSAKKISSRQIRAQATQTINPVIQCAA